MRDEDHVLEVLQDVFKILGGVGIEDELLSAVSVHVADNCDHVRSLVARRLRHKLL